MEKKGDLINQLAVISDLMENLNLKFKNPTITFQVSEQEYVDTYKIISQRARFSMQIPKDKFNITIGSVNVVFEKNNV